MYVVTAVIKPHKLGDVKDALAEVGINGMTVTEVRGFGRQKGHAEVYRGTEYEVAFVPKVKIEVLVCASNRDPVIQAIVAAAGTKTIGDGKIWATELDVVARIRTGELGEDAI